MTRAQSYQLDVTLLPTVSNLYTPRERERERPSSRFYHWPSREAEADAWYHVGFETSSTSRYSSVIYDGELYYSIHRPANTCRSEHKAIIHIRSNAFYFFNRTKKKEKKKKIIIACFQIEIRKIIVSNHPKMIYRLRETRRYRSDIDRIDIDDNEEATKRAAVRSTWLRYLSPNGNAVCIYIYIWGAIYAGYSSVKWGALL